MTMNVGLSAAAIRLLNSSVGSIEKLEVVIALARAAERSSSIVELARETRLPPAIARKITGEMQRARVVEVTSRGEVRLYPRDATDRAAVEEVLDMHQRSPTLLMRFLAGTRS